MKNNRHIVHILYNLLHDNNLIRKCGELCEMSEENGLRELIANNGSFFLFLQIY